MARSYVTTTTINTGSAGFTLAAAGDSLHVSTGISLGSTTHDGIYAASEAIVQVWGEVFGNNGIYLADNSISGFGAGSSVFIGYTGTVSSAPGYNGVRVDFGSLLLDNYGTIAATGIGDQSHGVVSGNSTATINNFGTISSNANAIVLTSGGTLRNYGTIAGTWASLVSTTGASADTVINQGNMVGAVNLGDGADVYNGTGGRLDGGLNGGEGSDTLTGGDFAETINGDGGADTIRGNGGVDGLNGGSGDDHVYFSIEDSFVFGSSGTDRAYNTYDAYGLTFDVGGNEFELYFGSAAGETIITTTTAGFTADGRGGNDLLRGGNGFDVLSGGDGEDEIQGGAGADTLSGGNGWDRITGGSGTDTLTGGDGLDNFVFNGFDSSVDTISDFTVGIDKIEILRSGFLSPAQWSAGSLDPARFVASANPSPIIGTACFLFDNAGPGVGTLYWNDGSGSANGIAVVQFAPGQNPLFFTAQDFLLV